MDKQKKVALYARVSKDEMSSDGRLQNPDNQLLPMRKFCEAMNWTISDEFIDRCSGGNSNRPEFQRMLARVRQRHFDIVLVSALDRLSREGILNTLSYLKQFKQYNTALRSMQESWCDTGEEGMGELLIAITAWHAKQERKKISDRTKAGLARRKAQGVKLGRPRKNAPPKK